MYKNIEDTPHTISERLRHAANLGFLQAVKHDKGEKEAEERAKNAIEKFCNDNPLESEQLRYAVYIGMNMGRTFRERKYHENAIFKAKYKKMLKPYEP